MNISKLEFEAMEARVNAGRKPKVCRHCHGSGKISKCSENIVGCAPCPMCQFSKSNPQKMTVPELIVKISEFKRIVINGQIRGGKNNIIITRSGRRVPNAQWARWRDKALEEVKAQLPSGWEAISEPLSVRLDYVAGDRRRRDFPAICDAIWHVLEKAGVVTDDAHLWPSESMRSYSKESPMAVITFL